MHDARFITKATGTAEQEHDWMVSSLWGNQLRFRLKTNGTTSTLVSNPGEIVVGVWYHDTAVYYGDQMRVYKNGLQNDPKITLT